MISAGVMAFYFQQYTCVINLQTFTLKNAGAVKVTF